MRRQKLVKKFETIPQPPYMSKETEIILPPKLEHSIAIHEGGHAIILYMLEDEADFLLDGITIKEKDGNFGAVLVTDKPEANQPTLTNLKAYITYLYGGLNAERLFLKTGDQTAGSHKDLSTATKIAGDIVKMLGLSNNLIPADYNALLDKNQSPTLVKKINLEILNILDECNKRAHKILEENHDNVLALADEIIKRKTMNRQEVFDFLNHLQKQPTQQMEIIF